MTIRQLRRAAASISLFLLVVPALFAADTYKIDPVHSSVSFRVRHFVSKVQGRFKRFSGTVSMDQQNLAASSVQFAMEAASIDTDVADRDAHLRSADFFETEKYPEINFKSTKIVKKSSELYEVTGDFTMHGVTKSLTLPVKFLGLSKGPKKTLAGFEVEGVVNRKDFGINFNKALDQGGFMLGDDVEVDILLETVLQEPEKKDEKPS